MFFAGKASPPRDDYRPEIHDADGLFMLTGKGERIWRPLANPSGLGISSFGDTNPGGFGLLPRERAFMHLDTAMTMVDADAFSMYPYLPEEPRAWVLTPGDPSAAAFSLGALTSTTATRSTGFCPPRSRGTTLPSSGRPRRGCAGLPKTTARKGGPMPNGKSINIGLNHVDPDHYEGWEGALVACEFDAEDMNKLASAAGLDAQAILASDATAGLRRSNHQWLQTCICGRQHIGLCLPQLIGNTPGTE